MCRFYRLLTKQKLYEKVTKIKCLSLRGANSCALLCSTSAGGKPERAISVESSLHFHCGTGGRNFLHANTKRLMVIEVLWAILAETARPAKRTKKALAEATQYLESRRGETFDVEKIEDKFEGVWVNLIPCENAQLIVSVATPQGFYKFRLEDTARLLDQLWASEPQFRVKKRDCEDDTERANEVFDLAGRLGGKKVLAEAEKVKAGGAGYVSKMALRPLHAEIALLFRHKLIHIEIMGDAQVEAIIAALKEQGVTREEIKKGEFELENVAELLPEKWERSQKGYKHQISQGCVVFG